MSDAEAKEGATREAAEGRDRVAEWLRELFVFRAGGRLFAVFREEVEAAAESLRPAPLPFAPRAVVGVVALRGRVRTALDPVKLFAALTHAPDETPPTPKTQPPRLFVALAGDEQLALACDSAEEPFTISADELRPDPDGPVRGLVSHEGRDVIVLDPARLYDAAMRGRDRRRRRT